VTRFNSPRQALDKRHCRLGELPSFSHNFIVDNLCQIYYVIAGFVAGACIVAGIVEFIFVGIVASMVAVVYIISGVCIVAIVCIGGVGIVASVDIAAVVCIVAVVCALLPVGALFQVWAL
jgi:hypothetical protein